MKNWHSGCYVVEHFWGWPMVKTHSSIPIDTHECQAVNPDNTWEILSHPRVQLEKAWTYAKYIVGNFKKTFSFVSVYFEKSNKNSVQGSETPSLWRTLSTATFLQSPTLTLTGQWGWCWIWSRAKKSTQRKFCKESIYKDWQSVVWGQLEKAWTYWKYIVGNFKKIFSCVWVYFEK